MPRPSSTQRKALEAAAETYHESLYENDKAIMYLEARGLQDQEVVDGFLLGYVDEPVMEEHQYYSGRISIPYLTPGGVQAIKFRCIKDHDCKTVPKHAKYLPGNDLLYNVKALHDATDTLYVTEGEFNAIVMSVLGFPCVATGSAGKFEEHWPRLFGGFPNVIGLCDGDEAGEEFGERLKAHVDWARLVHFPSGEDPNSLAMRHDLNDLTNLLS